MFWIEDQENSTFSVLSFVLYPRDGGGCHLER